MQIRSPPSYEGREVGWLHGPTPEITPWLPVTGDYELIEETARDGWRKLGDLGRRSRKNSDEIEKYVV